MMITGKPFAPTHWDSKDLKTYHVIDSLGSAVHLDRKMKLLGALLTGRLPIGPVDLLLNRLMAYNGYEGFRLGAGLATNDRITRYGSLGGYFAYGFKDRQWKYGGDLTIKPFYGRDFHLKASYSNDLSETGGVAFNGQSQGFSTESSRLFFADRMDRTERFAGEVMTRVGSSLKLWIGTERALRVNDIGYQYREQLGEGITRYRNDFLTGAITFHLRWAFREKLARLPDRELALGSKYPVLYVHAMRAMKGLWEGEWDTWRLDAMVEKTFRIRLVGNLSVRVLGGVADANAPMAFLYNLRGTSSAKFPLSVDNTFQTMLPNEFLADRYVEIHLRHSFGKLLVKSKYFNPQPALLSSAAFGDISHPENHSGLTFTSLRQGYFESGVVIDNLLKSGLSSLGAGVFYRYGPYALEKTGDNIMFKFTIAYAL